MSSGPVAFLQLSGRGRLVCWAAEQAGMASAGLGKGWGAHGLTHAADAPLSTSGSCNNLGREENAPTRAHTPVKRLCVIPQKCLVPNLRIAALMNSRRCFECQTDFSRCCRRCSSPHPCAGAGSGQGWDGRAQRSLRAACQGCPPQQCLWTKAGWRLSKDNSTVRNPTSDTPCSREAQPRNRQRVGFYRCRAEPQPPARLQSARLAAPWVTSACRALLGLDLSWEFFKGHL